jgi:tetratricopeptide (TPR) repeat protein
MVRYDRNEDFIGRDTFLTELHDAFHHPSTDKYRGRIALFGLGGIGKTQIALEYVYRFTNTYTRIFWISADTQASLLDGYRKIADLVGVQITSAAHAFEIAEKTISWLERDGNWLLVVDNLDNLEILSPTEEPNSKILLLPSTGPHRHTLITTRNRYADGIPAQAKEVTKFNQNQSLHLLYELSKISPGPNSEEAKAAVQLVEELDHLPLAISQAAAYIRESETSFTAFLTEYAKYRRDLLDWQPQGVRHYPKTLAATWRMSFEAIQKNNPMAIELLRLFSFLNPDGILIQFLQSGVENSLNDLAELISHRLSLNRAIIELERFSLVKRSRIKEDETVVIHRLVQAVVRDEMKTETALEFRKAVVNICLLAFPKVWHKLEDRIRCRLFVGQVMTPLLDHDLIPSKTSVQVLTHVGWFLGEDGNMTDSEILVLKSSKIGDDCLGPDHATTLAAKHELAQTYNSQGKFIEAATLWREVLEKRMRILGEEHPNTLSTMHNLASTYWFQGKLVEAAALGEKVLEKKRRILGEEHPGTLTTMHNLASTYWSQGKLVEGAALGEEVLEKRRRILGEEHPDTLTTMHDLAATYQLQGKRAEAKQLKAEMLAFLRQGNGSAELREIYAEEYMPIIPSR